MGYHNTKGEFSGSDDVTLMQASAIAATTNGGAVEVRKGTCRLTLNVTGRTGTATLDLAIETRSDSTDSWRSIAAFAQKSSVTSERKCFAGCDREVRAVATVGGSGTLTFTVAGDAV